MKSTVSVIIPVYNEVRTISSILEIVRTWGKAQEIIVVDDGSTDKTVKAVRKFGHDVQLITVKNNRGKGWALSLGIAKSHGDILMFLDGDVVGLTHTDLSAMLLPISQQRADMVLGVARFWSTTVGKRTIEPFTDITGERVLLRKNIIDHLTDMKNVGYGVELLLNDLHASKRVVRVMLPFVYILGKFEKQKLPDAMISYIKEATDLIAQAVRQGTGDLPPQAKKIFIGVQEYLRRILDYLQ